MNAHRVPYATSLARIATTAAARIACTAAAALGLAWVPFPSAPLRPAPHELTAPGTLRVNVTANDAASAAKVDVLSGATVVVTGRAGEPLAVPPGAGYAVRVTPDAFKCAVRSVPDVTIAAGTASTLTVPFQVGDLRVQIFHAGAPTSGLAEVFLPGAPVSCAHTGHNGVLHLEAGAYRVKIRHGMTVKWVDATVVSGAMVGATATF
ncbi:MAG TPA: hypothetical protein VG389_28455 [Myxococcota bacterium]|jgi:hypothetical protein|nr:hypothetical protein [Myxococcota bacterium]